MLYDPTRPTTTDALRTLCERQRAMIGRQAESVATLANAAVAALVDVRYALRQLRDHRCIDRAIDALERAELTLTPTEDE